MGDEILAINDVRLDSSLTQDGIVQLIVDSVITGNLALDIRRYGKAKKSKASLSIEIMQTLSKTDLFGIPSFELFARKTW